MTNENGHAITTLRVRPLRNKVRTKLELPGSQLGLVEVTVYGQTVAVLDSAELGRSGHHPILWIDDRVAGQRGTIERVADQAVKLMDASEKAGVMGQDG